MIPSRINDGNPQSEGPSIRPARRGPFPRTYPNTGTTPTEHCMEHISHRLAYGGHRPPVRGHASPLLFSVADDDNRTEEIPENHKRARMASSWNESLEDPEAAPHARRLQGHAQVRLRARVPLGHRRVGGTDRDEFAGVAQSPRASDGPRRSLGTGPSARGGGDAHGVSGPSHLAGEARPRLRTLRPARPYRPGGAGPGVQGAAPPDGSLGRTQGGLARWIAEQSGQSPGSSAR